MALIWRLAKVEYESAPLVPILAYGSKRIRVVPSAYLEIPKGAQVGHKVLGSGG
jgi:hypothetical protein